MVNNIKSEKGITLTALIVYIIVLSIVMGIVTSISTFFYDNIFIIRDSAKYASEFDKFNSFIVIDVKNNMKVNVDSENKTIIFEDGTTYVYNQNDKGIYRGKVKVATNVSRLECSKKIITVNNIDKQILSIDIVIGNSKKTLVNKKIDYTLRYW